MNVPEEHPTNTLSRGPDVVALIPTSGGPRPGDILDAALLRLGPDELARFEDAAAQHCASTGSRAALPVPGSPDLHRARTTPLTGREAEVLALLTGGITNRSIANRLGISERTVREHVARIMLKLRVESRVKAAVVATEWRLGGYPAAQGHARGPAGLRSPLAAGDGQLMPPP